MTLQPVRRHGVDAAVMFADIMMPVLGMGVDVELVEGVGPVVEEPVRTAADVERLRVPDRRRSSRSSRRSGSSARELEPERGARRLLRRAVHRRRLPDRGEAEPRLRRVKTLMYREPAVWHALMEKLTETFAPTSPRRSRPAPT